MMKAWVNILATASMLFLAELAHATPVDKREVIIDENGVNRLDRDGVPGKTDADAPRYSIKHSHRTGVHDASTNAVGRDSSVLGNDERKNSIEAF